MATLASESRLVRPLSEKPLHLDTLAGVQAEAEAAFHLAFYVAELTGQSETRRFLMTTHYCCDS